MAIILADTVLFFGRFHSVLVHLPIGFILLAAIFELISQKKKVDLDTAIIFGLFLGTIFAILAIILGLLLASGGGYSESGVTLHKWSAITTALLSLSAWWLKLNSKRGKLFKRAYLINLGSAVLLLVITGHFGGNLTHGSNYLLEHAPNPIRKLAGLKPDRVRITNLDSAVVYLDVIQPILKVKCNVCHNENKFKGELIMTDRGSIMKGGENGAVITPGDPENSEIIRRINLDPYHDDFMPSEGREPLTKAETELLEWWILEKASFDKKISDLIIDDRVIGQLRQVGIGVEKSFVESIELPPLNPQNYNAIVSAGFILKPITGESSLLEARYSPYSPEELSYEKFKTLSLANEHITWLSLSGCKLNDEELQFIGKMINLTRLKIDKTKVTGAGMKELVNLKNLEYLNLYQTSIDDEAIESLKELKGLRKLYLWQTDISDSGIDMLLESIPGIEIISGEFGGS